MTPERAVLIRQWIVVACCLGVAAFTGYNVGYVHGALNTAETYQKHIKSLLGP